MAQLLRKQHKWTNKRETDSGTENKGMPWERGGEGMAERGEEEWQAQTSAYLKKAPGR